MQMNNVFKNKASNSINLHNYIYLQSYIYYNWVAFLLDNEYLYHII